jgi:hypothetical protein
VLCFIQANSRSGDPTFAPASAAEVEVPDAVTDEDDGRDVDDDVWLQADTQVAATAIAGSHLPNGFPERSATGGKHPRCSRCCHACGHSPWTRRSAIDGDPNEGRRVVVPTAPPMPTAAEAPRRDGKSGGRAPMPRSLLGEHRSEGDDTTGDGRVLRHESTASEPRRRAYQGRGSRVECVRTQRLRQTPVRGGRRPPDDGCLG